LGIDWVLKQETSGGRRGIRWTLTSVLEDLDYADDIALLAHRHQDMQAKTNALATTAGKLSLKINIKKTRYLRMSGRTDESIMVNGEVVGEVDHFTYLGSKVYVCMRWRRRDPSSDFKGKQGLCLASRHLEIQEHQPDDKDPIFQKQCLKHSTVWRRILEDDQNHQPQARNLPEQVPAQDSPYVLAPDNLKL